MTKTYIYAGSQILAQHDGSHTASRYFYLHDRLGSVRQIIDASGDVENYYTYEPYGDTIESAETITNPFKFTGQYHDAEIGEYHLRARQYNPYLARFTARDPVFGRHKEPFTLHKYLYCYNSPTNIIDPAGEEGTYASIASSIVTRSILSGIGSGVFAGINNKARGGEFWKGFASGFAGGFAGGLTGHMFASVSAAGYIAAAVSGAVSGGYGALLDGQSGKRALVDAVAGGIISLGVSAVVGKAVDLDYNARGLPWGHGFEDDITDIAMPVVGEMGSDIWKGAVEAYYEW